MGKMKEKYTEEQENQIKEAVEAFIDDDYQYKEYLNTLGKSLSQEESQANHDAWWDSLTDKQKQQLFKGKEEVDNMSIEEMNHGFKNIRLNLGK